MFWNQSSCRSFPCIGPEAADACLLGAEPARPGMDSLAAGLTRKSECCVCSLASVAVEPCAVAVASSSSAVAAVGLDPASFAVADSAVPVECWMPVGCRPAKTAHADQSRCPLARRVQMTTLVAVAFSFAVAAEVVVEPASFQAIAAVAEHQWSVVPLASSHSSGVSR